MSKKKRTCINYDCTNESYLAGYCKKHYQEYIFNQERRDSTIRTLRSYSINDSPLTNENLRKELDQLCEWWSRICSVLNNNRGTELMPLDEAEFAKEWCITLAQKIIDDEIAFRSGKQIDNSYDLNYERLWNRFKNLEKGLTSTGVERKIKR